MIMTQRITSLAYSLYDGKRKESAIINDEEGGTKRELMIEPRDWPDFLTYCGFLFNVFGVVVGPLCFYHEYLQWIRVGLLALLCRASIGC